MKKLKFLFFPFLFVLSLFMLVSCGGNSNTETTTYSYKDGTYSGRSEDHSGDDTGVGAGYATCTITISDNKITACEILCYELNGTLKDDSYGSDLSSENRLKAQKAIQAAKQYAKSLVNTNDVTKVDVISGATITHSEFVEAVNDALLKARA